MANSMESWLQLLTLQTLLMLLACFQCTIAKEESYPQMNEVQNSLEKWKKNYPCNGKLIHTKCCIVAALMQISYYILLFLNL